MILKRLDNPRRYEAVCKLCPHREVQRADSEAGAVATLTCGHGWGIGCSDRTIHRYLICPDCRGANKADETGLCACDQIELGKLYVAYLMDDETEGATDADWTAWLQSREWRRRDPEQEAAARRKRYARGKSHEGAKHTKGKT